MSEVQAWVRDRALPLSALISDAGDEDLRCLDRILDGVTVVGLGESSHGTSEFFQVRHRILRYLVTKLGFRRFAAEASYSATRDVNAYLLGESNDHVAALAAFGHPFWQVEEFADVLRWLRSYNASADGDPVTFVGVDFLETGPDRERILRFLRDARSSSLPAAEAAFEQIANVGARLGLLSVEAKRSLIELTDVLVAEVAASEIAESAVVQHAHCISQWVRINAPCPEVRLLRGGTVDVFGRSQYMADNLFRLTDLENEKVALWAHNIHVGDGYLDVDLGVVATMGTAVRSRLGRQYYAFALELGGGSCLARPWSPVERTVGDPTVVPLPPAPEGSVPWVFRQAALAAFLLDLREDAPAAVEEWLTTPHAAHSVPFNHSESPKLYNDVVLRETYGGIVFVDETTATRPVEVP